MKTLNLLTFLLVNCLFGIVAAQDKEEKIPRKYTADPNVEKYLSDKSFGLDSKFGLYTSLSGFLVDRITIGGMVRISKRFVALAEYNLGSRGMEGVATPTISVDALAKDKPELDDLYYSDPRSTRRGGATIAVLYKIAGIPISKTFGIGPYYWHCQLRF